MSDNRFENSFAATMGHEGGYANDPTDVGGETYRGIARRFHPGWPGWAIVDGAKKDNSFPANLTVTEPHNALSARVREFYRQHYWDVWQGDAVAALSGSVARELFDSGVNVGVPRAVSWLQTGLNVLNRNHSLYPDLVVDGSLGATTLQALKTYLENDAETLLLKIMNVLQGAHYLEYMVKSPVQEKYARGWFNRVEVDKS